MVTFKLMEVNGNIAVYHYWVENNEKESPDDYGSLAFDMETKNSETPEVAPGDCWNTLTVEDLMKEREWMNQQRKEEGRPPLTDGEYPLPKHDLHFTNYGQMAYVEIKRAFERMGELPKDGGNIWY